MELLEKQGWVKESNTRYSANQLRITISKKHAILSYGLNVDYRRYYKGPGYYRNIDQVHPKDINQLLESALLIPQITKNSINFLKSLNITDIKKEQELDVQFEVDNKLSLISPTTDGYDIMIDYHSDVYYNNYNGKYPIIKLNKQYKPDTIFLKLEKLTGTNHSNHISEDYLRSYNQEYWILLSDERRKNSYITNHEMKIMYPVNSEETQFINIPIPISPFITKYFEQLMPKFINETMK